MYSYGVHMCGFYGAFGILSLIVEVEKCQSIPKQNIVFDYTQKETFFKLTRHIIVNL